MPEVVIFSVIALLSLPVCASQVGGIALVDLGGEARAVEVLKSEWAEQGKPVERLGGTGRGRRERHDGGQRPGPGGKPAGQPSGVRRLHSGAPWAFCAIYPMAEHLGWVPSTAPHGAQPSGNSALMAVPSIHRVLAAAPTQGIPSDRAQAPTDWPQFVAVADKLRTGHPLAIGNEPLADRGAVRNGGPRRRGRTAS